MFHNDEDPHLYGSDFPVHELVFGRGTFKPFSCELHWVPRAVDVGQDLDRDHCPDVLGHVVDSRQVVDDLIAVAWPPMSDNRGSRGDAHSQSDLFTTARLVPFFCGVIDDCGPEVVKSVGETQELQFEVSLDASGRWRL